MTGIFSNDKLGLTRNWHDVPASCPRPESAVEFDRRGGLSRHIEIHQQAEYWREKNRKFKSMGESRKNGKRNNREAKAV